MSGLPPAVVLLLTLAALGVLATQLAQHIQRLVLVLTRSPRVASGVYDLLLLPGIVLHEIAHIVVAVLLGVRVLRFDLFRFRRSGDTRQGEVVVARVDPLRMSLVGAAPLLLGVPVVLILLDLLSLPPLDFEAVRATIGALRPVMREPRNLLVLYLLWAVANTMFPSAADRAAWRIVVVVVGVVVLLVVLTGLRPTVPSGLLQTLQAGADRLARGLQPVVVLDLGLLLVVVALEWLARQVPGR